MNIVYDAKSIAADAAVSAEADQAAALAAAIATSPGLLTIDLDAIAANWRKLEKTAVPAECAAVVKANAYGCGIGPVTRALANASCKTFFVATLDEARAVRAISSSAAVYVLSGFMQNSGDAFAQINCQPVIGDLYELAEWDVFCRRTGWNGGAAIHIDTGMSRLGLTITEAQGIVPRINAGDHGITLVLSHLACADTVNHPLNAKQVASFREIASLFSGVPASLAASSGIFLGSHFHFDVVRPGVALYGVNPTPEADNPMLPVVDLKAKILQVRNVEKGDSVGYGATWTARRPTRLAVIATGYADGYFRACGSSDGTRGADVVIAGKRCPVAGRISMDLLAVDITDLPANAARRGHLATLIGDGITVDELAHHFGTIGYEVLTSLGRRYARVYKGGDAVAVTPAEHPEGETAAS
ncbi:MULTISPECIES: alanine racemase [Rhodopseudomonas]|uniref:Alanine racemase n=1 Tax=Rhodopseudomonas palustris TaxID=1076 RepID=A0A0D7ETI7_RHOPL|nr:MULTISPECIES: alanine racemase [Rhodopseudomonas]KIZ43966.1 alanine racemase [Rhodopseudomonas palustris]MDF3810115.1 alanine racemase [Rhodopseudomonas sp. BAL398]WOK19295.1 alanine racemase [Rhodopseudomonas sp. BAL398]